MCRVTALLPVAQGVAAYAALEHEAGRLVGVGDGRSRGQVMADTLTERVTGQTTADAVPVEITLTMSDQALFGNSGNSGNSGVSGVRNEPAWIDGYGPVPAGWARDRANDNTGRRWIRRFYTRRGHLVAPDSDRLAALCRAVSTTPRRLPPAPTTPRRGTRAAAAGAARCPGNR